MKKQIPNLITCLNATSGAIAVLLAFHGQLSAAALAILAAMVFDFFDGFAARLLRVTSPLGKEFDSLADAISFGLAPAVLAHLLISDVAVFQSFTAAYAYRPWFLSLLVYAPVLIPPLSVYRLAKFNLDTRQAHTFIGLPTPANALFWVALVLCYRHAHAAFLQVWASPVLLALCAVILAILLVSEIPMFSLKLTSFSWRANRALYVYLLLLLVGTILYGLPALTFAIPLYILVSLLAPRPQN